MFTYRHRVVLSTVLRLLVVSAIIGLSTSGVALAQKRIGCNRQTQIEAEQVAGTAATWRELYGTFVLYRDCDDGSIGEGFTESVTVLLSDRWNQLPDLASFAAVEPKFLSFVLRHVNGSADEKRLDTIAELSSKKCPATLGDLCRRLEQRTRAALKKL